VREVGRDGAFVVVDLYNYGPYNFHASDVSYNDYADSEDDLNEFALDDSDDPTEDYPCYECGSTIFLHHTKLCDLAEANAKRDLPAEPGSQVWTGEIPKGLAPIPGLAEGEVTRTPTGIVHKATDKYGAGEEPSNRRDSGIYARDMDRIDKQKIKDLDSSMGITWKNRGTLGVEVDEQLAAEDNQEKVGNMPADKFDDAMVRLKKLAGAGPLKTVWDPQKRVYKNMPTAVQPKK
jgi:hypothetical protein